MITIILNMYNLLTKTVIMINSINISEKTNEELIKDLEVKKAEAVASDDFEEAIKIRDQIKELKSKEITEESESDVAEKADQIEANAKEHKKDMDDMKVKADEEKNSKLNDLMWQLNDDSDLEKKEVTKESLEWKLKDYFNTLATNQEKALFLAQLLQNKNKWEEWLDTNSSDYNAGIWVFGSVMRWFNLKEENVRSLYMWMKIPINEEIYSDNELSKSAIDSFVRENLKKLAKDDNFMKGIKSYVNEIWWISGMENQVEWFRDVLNKAWIELSDWSNESTKNLDKVDSILDELELRNIALKKIGEAVNLLTQSNGLSRLKEHDADYFNKNYNWKVDERWYLYDKEWKVTYNVPSQIDTSTVLNWDQDQKDAMIQLDEYLNDGDFYSRSDLVISDKNALDELELRNIALKKIGEAVNLLTQSNGLSRLKEHDADYFNKNYNWKVDERWYLYDKEWKVTYNVPSQIDTSTVLNWDQDQKDAVKFIRFTLK